jgi:acyl-lipid omega-6 desaturase (Delta-12 desaturase)
MKTGPIWAWFTANIGYHHIHHLNARIPFYRLPEVVNAIPELNHPQDHLAPSVESSAACA